MSEVRVCTLLESYYPVVGGMETQARNLATILRDQGVEQIIVTRRTSTELAKAEEVDGIPVFRSGPCGRSSRYRWLFMLTCIPLLICKRKMYDVILVPGFRVLGIAAVLITVLLGKRSVLKAECIGEMSGEFFTGGLDSVKMTRSAFLFRMLLSLRNKWLAKASAFVSMYTEMTEEFEQNGVPPEKITKIPQSVNQDRFSPSSDEEKVTLRKKLQLPIDAKIAVYTGRIVSYKGVPKLVDVWCTLRTEHPEATLVVCGSGGVDIFACEEEVRTAVKEHGLESHVLMPGAVTNVDEYMRASDIFVLPTENDAFPLCLLEAMACAMPIVTTTVGGLKDAMVHEDNGLIMQPGSTEELHNCLTRLLEDPELGQRIGKRAREDVDAKYTRDIIARQYVALFEKCMHS